MNEKAQARLYELYLLLIQEVEKAPPRSQVRVEVDIGDEGRISGQIFPAPRRPK